MNVNPAQNDLCPSARRLCLRGSLEVQVRSTLWTAWRPNSLGSHVKCGVLLSSAKIRDCGLLPSPCCSGWNRSQSWMKPSTRLRFPKLGSHHMSHAHSEPFRRDQSTWQSKLHGFHLLASFRCRAAWVRELIQHKSNRCWSPYCPTRRQQRISGSVVSLRSPSTHHSDHHGTHRSKVISTSQEAQPAPARR